MRQAAAVADMLARLREHLRMSEEHVKALRLRLAEIRTLQLADPLERCILQGMDAATVSSIAQSKKAIALLERASLHDVQSALNAIDPFMKAIGEHAWTCFRLKNSLDRGQGSLLDDYAVFHRVDAPPSSDRPVS
jgi:hypothetical protein